MGDEPSPPQHECDDPATCRHCRAADMLAANGQTPEAIAELLYVVGPDAILAKLTEPATDPDATTDDQTPGPERRQNPELGHIATTLRELGRTQR